MTFDNPFGLALYDKEQKGVHTPKRSKAEKALWEVRDGEGRVAGRYAEPTLCEQALRQAIAVTHDPGELDRLWGQNAGVVMALERQRGRKRQGGDTKTAGKMPLAAFYEQRLSELRAEDGPATGSKADVPADGADMAKGSGSRIAAAAGPAEARSGDSGSDPDKGDPEGAGAGVDGLPDGTGTETENAGAESPGANGQQAAPLSAPLAADRTVRLERPIQPLPKRIRSPEHLKRVASLPCLVWQRQPADAHHLKHIQPGEMSLKPGDQWTVPLCRIHHRAFHDRGDEAKWWAEQRIETIAIAEELWRDASRERHGGNGRAGAEAKA